MSTDAGIDDLMDGVSGAYKTMVAPVADRHRAPPAVVMHLDAVGLAKDLWSDETARAALVAAIDDAPDCNAEHG